MSSFAVHFIHTGFQADVTRQIRAFSSFPSNQAVETVFTRLLLLHRPEGRH
jgi:hypothetical protein